MSPRRALLLLALPIAAATIGILACEDSTPPPDDSAADATAPTLDSSTAIDGALPIADASTDGTADADDGSLFGTGKGLRVTFIGAEHTFPPEDETALKASFDEDTSLSASRSVNPTIDAAFLANVDVLVLDVLQRVPTAPELAAFETWIRAGHGVIAFGGYAGPGYSESYLALFGISRGAANLGSSTDYTTMVAGHPVANGVSSLRVYGDQPITTSNDAGAPFAMFGANVLGLTMVADKGRVLTYGGDWVLFNVEVNRVDDAGAKPTRVFWRNALLWAGGRL